MRHRASGGDPCAGRGDRRHDRSSPRAAMRRRPSLRRRRARPRSSRPIRTSATRRRPTPSSSPGQGRPAGEPEQRRRRRGRRTAREAHQRDVLGWPFTVSQSRRPRRDEGDRWGEGGEPVQGDPPIAIAGLNILVEWGPTTGRAATAAGRRQARRRCATWRRTSTCSCRRCAPARGGRAAVPARWPRRPPRPETTPEP